jgi:CheY-like chemotaxis protein
MSVATQTVLVIEDDLPTREVIQALLQDEGYLVETAVGGAALARIQAGGICLVLLDMRLPSEYGGGIIPQVAALAQGPPVVAMSASREFLADAQAAGAQATLAKPFGLDELLNLVARHCPPA